MDNQMKSTPVKAVRYHRDRVLQVPIYLGKLLRGFVYQNDWKVLPMCVLIAALLSMVIRNSFFVTREGTLKGAFALTCVALWNGCFNAILSVCRERRIVKREHRSGMHISSYMLAHMIYQALICLTQTALTLYVCRLMEVKFPTEGFITPWFMLDLGITVFLITFAAAMMSLFFSSLAHTTTAALTIMPFLLIFQLVFSGGIFSLPAWTSGLSEFTLSNFGLKCIAAQADYNERPMMMAWDTLNNCRNEPIHIEITGDELIRITTDEGSPIAKALHQLPVEVLDGTTAGKLVDDMVKAGVVDPYREKSISADMKLQDIFDTLGTENVKSYIIRLTSEASFNSAYERSEVNIIYCWLRIYVLGFVFAVMSVIAMEFIDNDRR